MRQLLVLSILLVVLTACTGSACKGNYFEYKAGQCCLDVNQNGICDSDERGPHMIDGSSNTAGTSVASASNDTAPCQASETMTTLQNVNSYSEARVALASSSYTNAGTNAGYDSTSAQIIMQLPDAQLSKDYEIYKYRGRFVLCDPCPANESLRPITQAVARHAFGVEVRTMADFKKVLIDQHVKSGEETAAIQLAQMTDEQFGQLMGGNYVERPDGLWMCS